MAPLFIALKNLETKMFRYSNLKVELKLPLKRSLRKEHKRLFLLRLCSYKSYNKMKLQWGDMKSHVTMFIILNFTLFFMFCMATRNALALTVR